MNMLTVVPLHDAADTVAEVVRRALLLAPVLVVDDGSSDGTGAIAERAGADVIRFDRRLGRAQALRAGIGVARGRGVRTLVTLDGDGVHDSRDLGTLLETARREPEAIVVGSRLASGSASGAARLGAAHVTGFWINWATGVTVGDPRSGFRAYPGALFDAIDPKAAGRVLETEILLEAARHGWRLVTVALAVGSESRRRGGLSSLLAGGPLARYLAAESARRWMTEIGDAAREVARMVGRDRVHARHAAVLEGATRYADSPASWALSIGVLTGQRAAHRLARWWRHPRLRRAGIVAWATVATPALFSAALLQALGPRWMPDLVTPLVRVGYSQERLDRTR